MQRTNLSRSIRWLTLFATLLLMAGPAFAGCLGKPGITIGPMWYSDETRDLEINLKNDNNDFSLGEVFWSLDVKNSMGEVVATRSGMKVVDKGESQTVFAEGLSFTSAGLYDFILKANSELNICGEQETEVQVEIMDKPACTTPPTRVPGGALVMSEGNTITYTAPDGCCFTINPFINTNVWYTLSPSTIQTIQSGESVTFTVTPKDPKAPASLVAFEWIECENQEFRGKEYVVITPRRPGPDTNFGGPYGPGISIGEFGDPVSVVGGNFFRSEIDIDNPSVRQLSFSRHYDSKFLDNGVIPSMGINWVHSFGSTVQFFGNTAVVQLDDGRRVYFDKNSNDWEVNVGSMRQAYGLGHLTESGNTAVFTDIKRKVQYTFNADGRLIKLDDGFLPIHISWNGADIVSATDSLGNVLTFTTDALARITSVTNGEATVDYTYSSNSELLSAEQQGFTDVSYAYDPTIVGQLRNITADGKPLLSNQYDPEFRVMSQTDAVGGLWEYAYDNGSSRVTDPDMVATTYTYNEAGKLTGYGVGSKQTRIDYNSFGQLQAVTDPEGNTTTYAHDANGFITSITNEDGTESYEYATRQFGDATVFDVAKITKRDGTELEYTYDARGRVTRVTDPAGMTAFGIDDRTGKVTTTTSPTGVVTENAYGTNGHLISYTPASGVVVNVETNAGGVITQETLPGGAQRTSTVNSLGSTTNHVDATGATTVSVYNDRGLLTERTFDNGGVLSYTYDNADRVIEVKQPTGEVSSIEYSDAGRVVSTHDPANNAKTYEYDATGNRTKSTDALGNETEYTYDDANRLISETTPRGNTTTLMRDALGRVSGMTAPSGSSASITYDANGSISSVVDGSGREVSYTYTPLSRVASQTVGNNITASFTYDASGALSEVTDPMGGSVVYARNSNGQITSITDQAGRATMYTYDENGRASTITLPGSTAATLSYDAEHRLTQIEYANGPTLNYNVDAFGKVTSTLFDSVAYDLSGRTIWSNGISLTRTNGNVTAYKIDEANLTVQYEYDANNNCTAIVDPSGGRMTLTYNDDNQVVSIQRPNGVTTTYTYDVDGNVSSIDEGGAITIALTYDRGGRIIESSRTGFLPATTPMEMFSATYDAANTRTDVASDAAGRTTEIGGATATWNDASQLTALAGSVGASFTYDGFNRLVSATVDGAATEYVWSDHVGDGTIAIIRTSAATLYAVPTANGQVAFVIDSASNDIYYPHYTESGNTHAVSDKAGDIKAQYDYTPFGQLIAERNDLSFTYPFQFGGVSGSVVPVVGNLYATTARMYDSEAGRFLSHDPVRSNHPQSMNPFQYANQDPVNYQDWTGREPGATPAADDPYAGFSPEFRARMREIQERYEREMAEIEREAEQRRRDREERERRDRESRERLERERQERAERERRDQEAFEAAQRKVRELNETFIPMPRRPEPTPTPEPTGEGTSTPGAGSSGTNPGAGSGAQPPSSGGTRTRPTPPPTTNNGGGQAPTPAPRPPRTNPGTGVPPGGTGRGSYNPGLPLVIQQIGAAAEGFWEGLSPSYIYDYYAN